MKEILIMDIESDKFEAVQNKPIKFRFAIIWNPNFEKICLTRPEFDNFLLSICKRQKKKEDIRYIVYAHNLMFDFSFCLKVFIENGFIVKPVENSGKLIFVKIGKYRNKTRKNKDGSIKEVQEFETYLEFRDSYSLFQTSLKNLGKFVGLEKIEHDKDFSEIPSDKDLEYCRRDCQVVYAALLKFSEFFSAELHDNINLEEIPLTTASSAFKIFKNINKESRFNNKKQKMEEYCPWILENEVLNDCFLKNFYFGGRVELFNANFVRNCSYYDINSLYPSVMINSVYHRPPYFWKSVSKSDLSNPKVLGFIAIIDESESLIPLIPCHYKNGLYFPARKKECFIFKEEYEYLISKGIHINLSQTLYSSEYPEKPFEYLKRYYEMKAKKDSMSYFYKILMNATYGRFGIDREKEVNEILPFNALMAKKEGYEIVEYNDFLYLKSKEIKELNFERNLILASKITAMARLELTKWIHRLLENDITVYYCDTDSIVCQENSILPLGTELGKFKKEHEFCWFQGLGNKEYCAKMADSYLVKCKGIHGATLESVFEYHEGGVKQLNVSKLKSMINNGFLDTPYNKVMLKKAKTIYHKRILTDSGSLPINSFECLKTIETINAKIISKSLKNLKNILLVEGGKNYEN